MLKDVSFWCVVLAIIIAMTVHHILSGSLIEGNTNIRDSMTFQVDVEAHPDLIKQEIEDLRGEILLLQDHLKNSQTIIDQIQEDAAEPVQDVPVDESGSIIEDPTIKDFTIDRKEYLYDISTCGKTGKDPPSRDDCNNVHNEPWFNNTSIHEYSGTEDDIAAAGSTASPGIHKWTVPKTGSYIIEAVGSSGGSIHGGPYECIIPSGSAKDGIERKISTKRAPGRKWLLVHGEEPAQVPSGVSSLETENKNCGTCYKNDGGWKISPKGNIEAEKLPFSCPELEPETGTGAETEPPLEEEWVNGILSSEDDVILQPGKGAKIKGIFYLTEGDTYNIIIGQQGTTPTSNDSNPWNGGAGGGGGTFMWKEESTLPLIVAGGGGGQGVMGHNILGYGGDASLTEDGTMGPLNKKHGDIPNPSNLVDNSGKGGKGGGDEGLDSRHSNNYTIKKSKGWDTILKMEGTTNNVGSNSMEGTTNVFDSESGFGGGGIMISHAGGGGGGYSGGGSVRYGTSGTNTMGGGGGGSYFHEDGFKKEDSETLDYNEGGGYIKIKLIKEYFFVEGNKVKCEDYEAYEPKDIQQCEEGSKALGFEWERGPRRNGWNNNDCKNEYAKCVWREEKDESLNLFEGDCLTSARRSAKANKGLMYNDRCKGQADYETNIIDNVYKTICVRPIKALEGQDE